MQLLNFAIIKLTFCLILGIVLGFAFNISLPQNLFFTGIGLLLLGAFYLMAKNQFRKTIWFGVFAFITMVFVGVLVTNFHNEKNNSKHYTHQLNKETDSLKIISFKIREVLKPNTYYDKYIVDLMEVNNKKVIGKTVLNTQKNAFTNPLKVDAVYVTKSQFKAVNHPLNPHQFNYKNYLEKKYIYHQLVTSEAALFKVKSNKKTRFGFANNIRNHINKKLKRYNFKPDELAIINALLLGQRQDISETVYTNYTNAGAIHILAISGLHIGIVFLLLQYVFKPIERVKNGKLLNSILIVSILWSFAIVAGLSASVTRAVTMFSIVAFAKNLNRPTNIYNTLALSMFVLLLFKPFFLFDIGFQLSYLAVFSIVTIDPLLHKLWKPKTKITSMYWRTLTVTISAQVGIIPLSLYYFHQFPSLFFLSNLIIIPLLGFILGSGICLIVLAVLNLLPPFLAEFYGGIIEFMNAIVGWISKQEAFLFKDIPFGILYVLAAYVFVFALVRFYIKRNYSTLKFLLITVLIGQCTLIYTLFQKPKNDFIIFHKSRFSLLGNTTNNSIRVASDFDSVTEAENSIIKNYTVGSHIKHIEKTTLQPFYILNNKKLLVIDSLGVYNIPSFRPDYVLLRQSPKINLNRLIDSIQPKHIIADGSNYKLYVAHWKTICIKQKIPFHQTSEKGYFVIEY